MKQVYTQQKETQTSSVRAHVKAWVLFIGFLVWLVAVKETFGQSANSSANKANTRLTELSPLAGACNIQVSAALQYMDGQGRYFRMQIWNQHGALVYDSQVNAPRNAPAAQMIAGGSIVVHKAK